MLNFYIEPISQLTTISEHNLENRIVLVEKMQMRFSL